MKNNTASDDEEPSDSEDNVDIAMIDWVFSHDDNDEGYQDKKDENNDQNEDDQVDEDQSKHHSVNKTYVYKNIKR